MSSGAHHAQGLPRVERSRSGARPSFRAVGERCVCPSAGAAQCPGWPGVADRSHAKCQAVSRSSWTSTASGFSWRPGTRRGSCAEYRDPAKYPPEDVVVVPLTKHKVESKHHPYLELSVDGKALGRLPFEIDLALTLEGVELTIQGGRIKKIKTGRTLGVGTLKCGGAVLHSIDRRLASLPGVIDLGEGYLYSGLTYPRAGVTCSRVSGAYSPRLLTIASTITAASGRLTRATSEPTGAPGRHHRSRSRTCRTTAAASPRRLLRLRYQPRDRPQHAADLIQQSPGPASPKWGETRAMTRTRRSASQGT